MFASSRALSAIDSINLVPSLIQLNRGFFFTEVRQVTCYPCCRAFHGPDFPGAGAGVGSGAANSAPEWSEPEPEPFKHGPGFPGAGAGSRAYVNIRQIAL